MNGARSPTCVRVYWNQGHLLAGPSEKVPWLVALTGCRFLFLGAVFISTKQCTLSVLYYKGLYYPKIFKVYSFSY